MDYNNLYKKIEQHVTGLYQKFNNPKLVYHSLNHTKGVVSRVKEIAAHYNLNERDLLVVYTAAWFHDTGYLLTEPAEHEAKSAELMKEFMEPQVEDTDLLPEITECIMATRMSNQPNNLLQQILCDADTYHFGTKDFNKSNQMVFEEHVLRTGNQSKKDWDENTVEVLSNHQFYTAYAKDLLNDRKKKNVKKLKKNAKKKDEKATIEVPDQLKAPNAFTTKGIQTMLRLTSENHMRLSDMADGKANILISVNSIIISVILTVLLRRLQIDTYLTIPTVIFLAFTLGTIIVAILATRPKVTEGTFTDQDVIDKRTNLLFFGNFHRSSLPAYEKAMQTMMTEPDYLYGSLVKDIFQLGVVLARKYKLIRLAYNIFMVGIIISVIAFAIAVFFNSPSGGTITNASGTPL